MIWCQKYRLWRNDYWAGFVSKKRFRNFKTTILISGRILKETGKDKWGASPQSLFYNKTTLVVPAFFFVQSGGNIWHRVSTSFHLSWRHTERAGWFSCIQPFFHEPYSLLVLSCYNWQLTICLPLLWKVAQNDLHLRGTIGFEDHRGRCCLT